MLHPNPNPGPPPSRTSRSDGRLLFFRTFLRQPRQIGSIIPSSRFLERRITRLADVAQSRVVVELGPGTGGTTRALLRAMRPDARLLTLELNPRLAGLVRARIADPRLIVHTGCASEIRRALAEHGLEQPDVVLSGIPFSTLPRPLALRILWEVYDVLPPGGRFVAYQVRDRVAVLGRQVFGAPNVAVELLNVPPMRIYRFFKSQQATPAVADQSR